MVSEAYLSRLVLRLQGYLQSFRMRNDRLT